MKNKEDPTLQPWWRYTWAEDGSIGSVTRVEGGREGGRRVGYVQAATQAEALAEAKRLIDRYDKRQRACSRHCRKRRAALKAAGLCTTCGADVGGRAARCDACNARRREREAAVTAGAPKLWRALSAEEKAANVRTYDARSASKKRKISAVLGEDVSRVCARRAMLRTVLDKFDSSRTREGFRQWLVRELADIDKRLIDARAKAGAE